MSETWTLSELAERAADTLRARSGNAAAAQTAAGGAGRAAQAANGRVREVPGARLIRWYTTIGLVDPPLTRRGRIALYGRRHLLQLVAIKRLQADGLSIAEIQTRLAGATDAHLATVAQVPRPQADEPEGPSPRPAPPEPAKARSRFWAAPPFPAPAPSPTPPELDGQAAGMVHGVRLAYGVTVLLDGAGRTPAPSDLAAITAAAAPLLAVLAERGLIATGPPTAHPDTQSNAIDPVDPTDIGPPATHPGAQSSPMDAGPTAAQSGTRSNVIDAAGPIGGGRGSARSGAEDATDLAGPTHVSHPEGSTA
ncbi:helix-turn-helix domain-containing protein [Spongiactinospora sp. 9N601]|uniref:helix-turn-helix domain-containing protein n=1 Tax=Spongiactinospora sp. 9N601 TaxID=3375149 RepID=UPI0037B97443